MTERKSVIITFKPKDQRRDRHTDKLEIVRKALTRGTRAHFLDATSMAKGGRTSIEDQIVGYDVDHYDAPIVTAQLTQREIQRLQEDDNVAKVEDDGPCHAAGFGPYRHLRLREPGDCPQAEEIPDNIKQVDADQAWGISTGAGIKVAILDTGIDYNHPDLAANYKGGVSYVAGNASPMDDQGHGTHCAGIIAAARNGHGLVGIAPDASLYAVKVLDAQATGRFSWSIAGIDWCTNNGINIINMSLGCEAAPSALELICNYAWSKKGILIVAGAGNQSDGDPVPPWQSNVEYPAKYYRDVIGVSSIDASNKIAPNSARGPEVKLCAPGVDIRSTLLDGKCGIGSGTSVASPHVAGVAALAWKAHEAAGIDNEGVWNLLAHTADNLGRPGRDSLYGYGRVNALAAVSATLPVPIMPKGKCCCEDAA